MYFELFTTLKYSSAISVKHGSTHSQINYSPPS